MRVKRPKSITTPICHRERLFAAHLAVLSLSLVLAPAVAHALMPALAPAAALQALPEDAVVIMERGWLVPDEATGRLRLVTAPPPAEAAPAEAPPDQAPADQAPADRAASEKTTLLLTGRFRYAGADTAQGLRVTLPVPADARYVPGSATGPGARVEYSVDGGVNFAPAREVASAVPDQLTHIRWIIPGEFPPGTAGLVSFQALAVEEETPAAPLGDPPDAPTATEDALPAAGEQRAKGGDESS